MAVIFLGMILSMNLGGLGLFMFGLIGASICIVLALLIAIWTVFQPHHALQIKRNILVASGAGLIWYLSTVFIAFLDLKPINQFFDNEVVLFIVLLRVTGVCSQLCGLLMHRVCPLLLFLYYSLFFGL